MWQALAVYFALVGLRVLLNYRSLRNYLKLPLVERPAAAERLPSVSVIGAGAAVETMDYPEVSAAASPDAATGDWLLFSPPSVEPRPESLDRAMRFALQHRAQAVSIFLQQRCETFWERVLLPYAYQQLFISRPAELRGQWLLIQREAYRRAEGHEAAQLEAAGVPVLIGRGERLASVRAWLGKHQLAPATVLGTVLSLLAIPCAIYGLAVGSRAFELAALVTYITSVAELSLWQFLFGTPISSALYQPLAAVLFLANAATKPSKR